MLSWFYVLRPGSKQFWRWGSIQLCCCVGWRVFGLIFKLLLYTYYYYCYSSWPYCIAWLSTNPSFPVAILWTITFWKKYSSSIGHRHMNVPYRYMSLRMHIITKASLLAGVGFALAMNWQTGRSCRAFSRRTGFGPLFMSNCDPPLGSNPATIPLGSAARFLQVHTHTDILHKMIFTGSVVNVTQCNAM